MTDLRNASHRPPPFFEWLYFHFVTPDGAAMNLVLHETDISGAENRPLFVDVHPSPRPTPGLPAS